MKILSVSTATNNLSVALNDDQTVIVEKNERDERNHSEHLDPLIAEILQANHLRLQDIDRFAVAIGPGSYTGLRIGITTVKLFASILQKEVVGLSTLKVLAANCPDAQALIIPAIDARNDNYFAGAYYQEHGQLVNVIPDGHYHIDRLIAALKTYTVEHKPVQLYLLGSGLEKQVASWQTLAVPYTIAQGSVNQVHAGIIGQLAVAAKPVDPDQLLPTYLRRTQAEVDWHQKTGKAFGSDRDYVEEV